MRRLANSSKPRPVQHQHRPNANHIPAKSESGNLQVASHGYRGLVYRCAWSQTIGVIWTPTLGGLFSEDQWNRPCSRIDVSSVSNEDMAEIPSVAVNASCCSQRDSLTVFHFMCVYW
ncbi:hypothetical protein MRX96_043520 [Rhipicephalus microplus]